MFTSFHSRKAYLARTITRSVTERLEHVSFILHKAAIIHPPLWYVLVRCGEVGPRSVCTIVGHADGSTFWYVVAADLSTASSNPSLEADTGWWQYTERR